MPNRLMEKLTTETLDFCCVYAYFSDEEIRLKPTSELAATLGVSERTIRWHRERVREGTCTCEHALKCWKSPLLKTASKR